MRQFFYATTVAGLTASWILDSPYSKASALFTAIILKLEDNA